MRFSSWTIGVIVAGAVALAGSGPVSADAQSPGDIIKARQQHLKEMGGALKAIVDQLKSGALDKGVVTEQATKVAALAKDLPTWFPKGTGEEAGVKTAAKAEIWAMPDDFKAAAEKLPPEADKLAEVAATGDAAAIGAQLQATGKACGGCHKVFRVPPPEGH
jgi:cytochrome c556